MSHIWHCALGLTFAAGVALAHSGVKNPQVKARMDTMVDIAAATKVLGQMAKGQRPFDPTAANTAAAAIAEHAATIPARFEPRADDPKSEARPEIWENFDDFTRKARALGNVADGLSDSIVQEAQLGPAMMALGKACKACHGTYRE